MSLKQLPSELILQVFQQIDDAKALQSVACTCAEFRDVAEICLYSRALITQRASMEQFMELCRSDTRRASYIHELQLLYSVRQYDRLETQPVDLLYFPCLGTFVSESPFCNGHSRIGKNDEGIWKADKEAYMRAFEKASLLSGIPKAEKPLSKLRSTSIHLRFWETSPACPVFLLPELHELELSCVKIKISESDPDLSAFRSKTALKSIIFRESIVSPDALEQILSLPSGLTTLVLHELNYHRTGTSFYNFFKDDLETSQRALSLQATSLRYFDFYGQYTGYTGRLERRSRCLDLSNMTALTYLQLDSGDCNIETPPPNLETLCLTNVDLRLLRVGMRPMLLKSVNLEECLRSCSVRKTEFRLDLRIHPQYPAWSVGQREDVSIRQVIANFQNKLDTFKHTLAELPEEDEPTGPLKPDNAGDGAASDISPELAPVRMRVLTAKRVSYIPPYLYREKAPKWIVRYDSDFLAHPYNEDRTLAEDDSSGDEEMSAAFRNGELS
ncbi:hypothetical protein TruAng_006131 [Truncatella angustata]|nr:hypothetical protein TruAng_006131 [Truncatella angustata]